MEPLLTFSISEMGKSSAHSYYGKMYTKNHINEFHEDSNIEYF